MQIKEVFIFYDEPLLYSSQDDNGNLYLVLSIGDGIWLYVNTSEDKIESMKQRKIDLYSVFTNKDLWHYNIHDYCFYTTNQIPKDLPEKGEYL